MSTQTGAGATSPRRERHPVIVRSIKGEDRLYRVGQFYQLPEVGRSGGAIFEIVGTFKGAAQQVQLWDHKMKRADALWYGVDFLDKASRTYPEGRSKDV